MSLKQAAENKTIMEKCPVVVEGLGALETLARMLSQWQDETSLVR